MTTANLLKLGLIFIPALLLALICWVCEHLADKSGCAAASLVKWAERRK